VQCSFNVVVFSACIHPVCYKDTIALHSDVSTGILYLVFNIFYSVC